MKKIYKLFINLGFKDLELFPPTTSFYFVFLALLSSCCGDTAFCVLLFDINLLLSSIPKIFDVDPIVYYGQNLLTGL